MGNLFSWKEQQPSGKVKPGDLIEISRKNKPYEDWALCVAENEVIHVVELCDRKAIIKQEKLEKVVGSDQWCVNHCLDEIYGAMAVQLMLEEAQKMNDTEIPYSLLTNYGKHKVPKWRHGKPESGQVQPGDMIEISRCYGLYKHWALYMGENEVIHVVSTGGEQDTKQKCCHLAAQQGKHRQEHRTMTSVCEGNGKAIIKQEKLEKVVGSDQWRVNNYVDEIYGARDIEVILYEAQQLKDKVVDYNVYTNNCEHMVTKLRCGKAVSRQADMAKMLMVLVLFVVVPIIVYWMKRRPVHRQVTGMHHRRSTTGRTEPVRHQGRQRSSTGPTEDKGETVSKEEIESPHAHTMAEMMSDIRQAAVRALWRSTTGPTEEERAVPRVEDGSEYYDMMSDIHQAAVRALWRSTTGPTEEERARGPGRHQFTDTDCCRSTTGPTEEERDTIPRVEDKSDLADMMSDIFRFTVRALGSSTTGPTEEEKAMMSDICRFTVRAFGSSTTGPTEEEKAFDRHQSALMQHHLTY